MEPIKIRGRKQNNLKNISLDIPKNKIIVFTGVSGSGTISDMYSALRLLFSRIGTPQVGPASYFSFNNPNGMCETCAGIGKVMDFDINNFIEQDKTYDEGFFLLPAFGTGKYYWKVYRRPEYFRTDVPWKDLTEREQNIVLYGSWTSLYFTWTTAFNFFRW